MNIKRTVPLDLELYRIAAAQNGFFTTLQAKAVGYKASNFKYYIQRGYWEYLTRRVYRLNTFPLQEHGQYTLWSLWVQDGKGNPQGVISHLSALGVYDLCDVVPHRIEMTVSPKFRPPHVPKILKLYKETIDPKDIKEHAGFLITKPAKTILDVAQKNLIQDHHLVQAIDNALWGGLMSLEFVKSHNELARLLPYVKDRRSKNSE